MNGTVDTDRSIDLQVVLIISPYELNIDTCFTNQGSASGPEIVARYYI